MDIRILPLDERPCNYEFVKKIGEYNKKVFIELIDYSALGCKKNPGNLELIEEFVFKSNSGYLILSLDMYLYGGLLPSRLHMLSKEVLFEKLEKLKSFKEKSSVKIYAFSTIMRTPRYNSSDEEPDYYKEYGEAIFYKKFLEDKNELLGLTDLERDKLDKLFVKDEYLKDYNMRRQINLEVNLKIVELLKQEVFEYLIFPQDDSAEYGYTRIDQSCVYKNLLSATNYSIHPGADEVAMTLLARIYNEGRDLKVYTDYINEESKNKIPNYEDRELIKTYNLHLKACNITSVDNPVDADYRVIYNLCEDVMIESWNQKLWKKNFDSSLFTGDLFILDCSYSNGGDLALINYLYDNRLMKNLKGYSGWNTNANSIGTLLCQLSLSDSVDEVKRNNFVLERIIEDCFYQSKVRMDINNGFLPSLGLNYFDLKDQQEKVVAMEKVVIDEEFGKFIGDKKYSLSHPWNRMFEIKIDIK